MLIFRVYAFRSNFRLNQKVWKDRWNNEIHDSILGIENYIKVPIILIFSGPNLQTLNIIRRIMMLRDFSITVVREVMPLYDIWQLFPMKLSQLGEYNKSDRQLEAGEQHDGKLFENRSRGGAPLRRFSMFVWGEFANCVANFILFCPSDELHVI